jgi:hypothetical protein
LLAGTLFTIDFLNEGIRSTQAWVALSDEDVAQFASRCRSLLNGFASRRDPIEAETESDLIWPVVEALGWADWLPQQKLSAKGREDIPDGLLFGSPPDKERAAGQPPLQRLEHALCFVEAKRWGRILDRADGRRGDVGVPSTQMLRYLRRIDDITGGGLRWGILTNGRVWRLYFSGAVSVAEDFLEIDLGKALGTPGCDLDLLDRPPPGFADAAAWQRHVLKLFLVLFGRSAFLPQERGESFHQLALREGRQWEARVARDLSNVVFARVFPLLADALARADRKADLDTAALAEVREGALILLYRILFVLYAEDRNLLPDETGPYAAYSLTRMRTEIADGRARGDRLSDRFTTYWSRLTGVFTAIANGDNDLGIPPYNGGLFAPDAAPILTRVQLSDAVMAEVLFGLSHLEDGDGGAPKYINYRDLSVQQLGSVYERILEYGLRVEAGRVVVADDPTARKSSGSYYTSEDLVALIIERAVGPLVEDRLSAFAERLALLAADHRPVAQRLSDLMAVDPASALLDLKVCDPAMGSGHFLVSLVDWLADRVLAAMAEAEATVRFGTYISPLAARIAEVRASIVAKARANGWPLVENQLEDRHIVRRMVLKRVVYGVDKNKMAVELAKVALWLHSFTVGAPLSFLDHHLRCGDSVVGMSVAGALATLRGVDPLFNIGQIASIEAVAGLMESIGERTDADIAEVEASKSTFAAVEEAIAPIAALFSLLTAERMMGVFDAAPSKAPQPLNKARAGDAKSLARLQAQHRAFADAEALQATLVGAFGKTLDVAQGARIASPELVAALDTDAPEDQPGLFPGLAGGDRRRALAQRLLDAAAERTAAHRFFHWQIGFPNVWSNLTSTAPRGGFDAVIGNPPYVRQELLGEEVKRALKADYTAFDGMADLYVYFYEQGLRLLRPGGRMSFVVTNKWLRAGYAEELRGLFAERGEVEFIADFGHAKHFFPDADVFPCVVVVRRPDPPARPAQETSVCVIPREAVPQKGLSAAVAAATYPLPRAHFTRQSWTLEPPEVVRLLDKIRRNGVPLAEYAGVKPYRGILTGLNEAFLIDTPTRDQLVRDDPKCGEIIRPYLRGQDIERWWSPPSGLHMIVMKSSGDYPWPWSGAPDDAAAETLFKEAYPSLHRHLKRWEAYVEDGVQRGLRLRQDHGRFWWELRPCAYYDLFDEACISYQAIQYYPNYSLEPGGRLGNNKTYFIRGQDEAVLAALNSPAGWYLSWRLFTHMKDEGLSNDQIKIVTFPIPVLSPSHRDALPAITSALATKRRILNENSNIILDWLRHEFGLDKPGRALAEPQRLDADGFVAAVRAALPRARKLSAADIARLKAEYAETVAPARAAAAEILTLERRLSDLVNAAYGLTPEEVALMWRTAPPRMPLDPAEELRRLGVS